MQRLAVLGSTGSIGTTSLEIADRHAEQFDIVALAAGSQWETLVSQTRRFRPQVVSLATEGAALAYREAMGTDAPTVLVGDDGLNAVAAHVDADLVINGLTGGVGVVPTISAIRAGKNVALANKEVLVIAGEIVNEEARANGVSLLPVDSEISAIWQCLAAGKHEEVRRILLTASGGAFRDLKADELHGVTPERALEHPNWVMGPKVTIDSATLMNKGFEIIEVRWLFDVPLEKIEVLLHHQSVIHSLVEYLDGSVIGQLGVPDMTLPIQYALTYPNRVDTHPEALDLAAIGSLTFGTPDTERFPALSLAREASRIGGTMPAVLSGADEVAVQAFLDKRIPFVGIPELVEATMERHDSIASPSLGDVLEAERWARLAAERRIEDVA
jgi:1-deoxy-D-xylulose-5-phosphate reductoisomerase